MGVGGQVLKITILRDGRARMAVVRLGGSFALSIDVLLLVWKDVGGSDG